MGLYRATLTGQIWGQNCKNVLHFLRDADSPDNNALLADQLKQFWVGPLASTQTSNFLWTQIQVEHIDENPIAPVFLSISIGGSFFTGTNVWGPMCFVYKLKTVSSNTRRNHGRVYISGIHPELVNGFWTQSRIGLMASVLDFWVPKFVGNSAQSGFSWIIANRDQDHPFRSGITEIIPRAFPGTQVRRNVFRGQ